MFRRVSRLAPIAFALVALCLCAPRYARAEPELALTWHAHDACPNEAWARARLRERLGREPTEGMRTLAARAELTREGTVFVLALRSEQAGTTDDRRLRAATCEELAEAAVLMLALALDAGAPAPAASPRPATDAEKPPGLVPTPVRGRRPEERLFAVRVAALASRGDQPSWGIGPEIAAALTRRFLRLELGGFWLMPRDSPARAQGAKVRMSLWALRPRVCAEVQLRALRYGACLGGELGRVGGRGQNLGENQQNHALWPAVSMAARLTVRLSEPLWLSTELGAAVPLDRPRFVSEGASAGTRTGLYEPGPVAARATLGLETRF